MEAMETETSAVTVTENIAAASLRRSLCQKTFAYFHTRAVLCGVLFLAVNFINGKEGKREKPGGPEVFI